MHIFPTGQSYDFFAVFVGDLGVNIDRVVKGTYMQTFETARVEVDHKIDEYFNQSLFGNSEDLIYKKKYNSWLVLFDKEDCPESKKQFDLFMQHEMQHEI